MAVSREKFSTNKIAFRERTKNTHRRGKLETFFLFRGRKALIHLNLIPFEFYMTLWIENSGSHVHKKKVIGGKRED